MDRDAYVGRVFDRELKADCKIDSSLLDATECCDFDNQDAELFAISQNWRADPSVSMERDSDLRDKYFSQTTDIFEALDSMGFDIRSDGISESPFFLAASNQQNISYKLAYDNSLAGYPGSELVDETRMFRIQQLNGQFQALNHFPSFVDDLRAVGIEQDVLDHYIGADRIGDLAAYAEVELNELVIGLISNSSHADKIKILNVILQSGYKDNRGKSKSMWWATRKSMIPGDLLMSGSWDAIIGSLGMGFQPPIKPFIAIVFPAKLARVLYRPTVVEAGNYMYFHPAEPSNRSFGRSVNLSESPDALSVHEYIFPALQSLEEDSCEVYIGHANEALDSYESQLINKRRTHQDSVLGNLDGSDDQKWCKYHWCNNV